MAKRLGFAPDRWTVFSVEGHSRKPPCSRATYTSYGDAAKAALRCSKKTRKPCLLLAGWASGTPRVIGRCRKGKCGRPKESDRYLIQHCGTAKKSRRAMIATRVREHADRARGIGPSKAAKTGVRPGAVFDEGSKSLNGRPKRKR